MEKFLSSVLAVLLPFIATYFSKKNKATIRKNLIDEAQNKVNFINSYFEVLNKLLPAAEIELLKQQLSKELHELKVEMSSLDKVETTTRYQRLGTIQKIFLTFIPLSWLGWLLALLFYICLFIILFGGMGIFLDDKGNFTVEALSQNEDLIIGLIIFIIMLLLFRWFAIRDYKSRSTPRQSIASGISAISGTALRT